MFKNLITLITVSLMAVSLMAQPQTPREMEFLENAGTGWIKAGPHVYEKRDEFGVTRVGFGQESLAYALMEAEIERDVCYEKMMDSENPNGWKLRVEECDSRIQYLNDAMAVSEDRLAMSGNFRFTPFFICGSHLDFNQVVSTMRWAGDRMELPGSSFVLVSAIAQQEETVDLEKDMSQFYGAGRLPYAQAELRGIAPGKAHKATLIARAYFCNTRINDDCFMERIWYCE